MADLFKKLFRAWLRVAHWLRPVGIVMTFLMMNAVFLLLLPFALVRFWDPLRLKRPTAGTYWVPIEDIEPTIERFKHPF